MKLLIVEDSLVQQTALKRLFEGHPSVELVVARNLTEAEALLENCDFVILDLSLADSDPEDSIDWMRSNGLPTIIFSGTHTQDVIDMAAEAGAFGFLTKGSAADQILTAVNFTLAKEKALSHHREKRIKICRDLTKQVLNQLNKLLHWNVKNGYKEETDQA